MRNGNHEQRREAIRALLLQRPAATQASLVAALTKAGHEVTQSSVSRDLREIGAIKTGNGYELATDSADGDAQMAAVGELLRTIQAAGPNLLVVHTAIGAAQRVALALDRCDWPGVVGNIGGDDTVFVATSSGIAQKKIIARIERVART